MNLPNKLTMFRIALIPVFVWLMLSRVFYWKFLYALIVFAAASITDYLDGHIARRDGLVTDFGKLMDPLADKLLVASALIAMVSLGFAPAVSVIIILAREFAVTSIRLIAASSGRVIAADVWGKMKTVSQMIWIMSVLLIRWLMMTSMLPISLWDAADLLMTLLMAVTTVLTVISGVNYFVKNKDCFMGSM